MRQHPIAIRGIRADSSANRRGQIRRGSTAAPLGSAVARWILAGLAGLAGCPGSGEFGDDTSEVDDDSALPDDDATADDDTTPQPDDDTTPLPDDDTTPPPDDDTTPPPDDDTTAPPDDDTSVWTGTAEVHWLTDEALAYIYLEYEGGFDDYPQFGRFVVSTADVSGDE